ncbi:MAG TPA: hypothetical protein PKM78_15210 [Anaerolineae bacterium]|nr:hypothetical protein [Anaerolineae bacterium]HNU05668.1 hypothetical protein [Anaerolineae bacterium]
MFQRLLGHGQRQPGLADAGRTDQGDQACVIREQPFAQRGDIAAASQQGRQLGGQVVGALWPQQARARRKVALCAACQGDHAGQISLGDGQRPGQGRGQRGRGVQVAALDLAQRHLRATDLLGQFLLCQMERPAALLEPVAKIALVSHTHVSHRGRRPRRSTLFNCHALTALWGRRARIISQNYRF